MRIEGTAARLTILVDENDTWHHHSVYVEIVRRAHDEGLAGATVLRGIEGFAGISDVHTTHLFQLGGHLPVLITIIDRHDRIQAFLSTLDNILNKGVAVLDDVEVIRFHREPATRHGRRSRNQTRGADT
jgi:PII-like signaling protein